MHTHAMHCIATGKHMKEEECKNLANVIRKVILHLPDDLKDVRNARFVCLLFFISLPHHHLTAPERNK